MASSTIGLSAVLAQEEAAERAFDAQDVLLLHRAEHMVGELAAGHVAQVQLDRRRAAQVCRRVGHRVAAPRAVAQDELDVLAGAVLEGRGWPAVAASSPRHRAPGGRSAARARASSAPGTRRRQARLRASTTQSVCGVAQQVRIQPASSSAADKAFRWCTPWITRPFEQAALARAAGAVAAAIGQADALRGWPRQDGFVALPRRRCRPAGWTVL